MSTENPQSLADFVGLLTRHQQANTYKIQVDNYQTGASFSVKAMIYGDTGDDSNGVVLIRKQ